MRMFTNSKNREEEKRINREIFETAKSVPDMFIEVIKKLLLISDDETNQNKEQKNNKK